MAQKMKKEQEKKIQIQESLIKSFRETSVSKYSSTWNSNLTVIENGHKTGLYKELRHLIG